MARQRIEDDAELIWEGPLAPLVRPMSYGTLRRAVVSGSLLYLVACAGFLPHLLGLVDIPDVNTGPMVAVGAFAVVGGLSSLLAFRGVPLEELQRRGPVMATVSHLLTPVLVGVAVANAGPNLMVSTGFFVAGPIYAFMVLRPRVAIGILLLHLASCGVALATIDGLPGRAQQWLVVVAAAGATAVAIGLVIRQTDEATRAERVAKAALADLNTHLEQRVADQVDELERTGRLRRFLAPQVADVVVSQRSEALLEPHSRDVVVLFCDLRGFTRFTNVSSPEVVMGVLAEYYATVGTELEAHGATIGGYDGDGVMAYLGDPIERPDAPAAAIAMARAIGTRLDALVARWQGDGHDLGCGMGLAYGPATLGVVGFDGRFDYTALGAVVNLAARLCSDAASGEIVIDDALRIAASVSDARPRGEVALKGYDELVPTFGLPR